MDTTQTNQLFRELFQLTDELVVFLNSSRKIEFMNSKAAEDLQISHNISSYLHLTEDSIKEWGNFTEELHRSPTASCNLTIINKEQKEINVTLIGNYIKDKQLIFGRVTVNTHNDHSPTEKANMLQLQQLINGISNGMVFTKLNGVVSTANHAALKLLDLELDHIENKSHDCLFEDCCYESHLIFNYYEKLSKKESAKLIVKKFDSNGKVQYLHFESKIDEPLGVILTTITDQTERMLLLEQVEHQKSLTIVGQNVATIAHEIRNPMTSIQGFLQMIKVYSENVNEEYFNIVESELQRMDELLKDLLDFSKPKKIDFTYVNLKKIMLEVVDILQPKAILTNTIIECEFDDVGEPTIYGNENRLKQMIINLVKNALEAVNVGGYIRVSLSYKSKDCIKLSVMDKGQGMNTAMLENIFNPFYTTKENGTGLGLLLVQSVIEEHRGTVTVESEEGKGTVFNIEFELSNNSYLSNPNLYYQYNDSIEQTS